MTDRLKIGAPYPDAALFTGSKLHYYFPAFFTTEKRAWKPTDLQEWDEERKSLGSSINSALLMAIFRHNHSWKDMPFIVMGDSASDWILDDMSAMLQDCRKDADKGIPFIQLAVEESTNVILRMDVLALPNDLSTDLLKAVTRQLACSPGMSVTGGSTASELPCLSTSAVRRCPRFS